MLLASGIVQSFTSHYERKAFGGLNFTSSE